MKYNIIGLILLSIIVIMYIRHSRKYELYTDKVNYIGP